MTPAFKYFTRGIMDYAGLFPPARLELAAALAEYEGWKSGPRSWLVSTFIIPAHMLGQLDQDGDFPLSVILPHPIPVDLEDRLAPFAHRIRALETRLPSELTTQAQIREYAAELLDQAARAGLSAPRLFVESPDPGLDAIVTLGCVRPELEAALAFKLRCGGEDPDAVPPPELVAELIWACRDADLPLKFTAGLHQPFSSDASAEETFHYGFINVFSAALLAFGTQIPLAEIQDCLTDPDPGHFTFVPTHFFWKSRSLDLEALQISRTQSVLGFGTCSVAEPVDALVQLGLMAPEE